MEVHHHSHTQRKKWTHYLWEFVMLFLAVFCGFLAENKREHIVEHQRARVYAANLLDEICKDTAALNRSMGKAIQTATRLDSFCVLSSSGKSPKGLLNYYASFIRNISLFSSENTTIAQLKGSGNMRLMNNEVSQKISSYEKQIQSLENEYQLTKTEFASMEQLYFKIFDGHAINSVSKGELAESRDTIIKMNFALINTDPTLMKEFTGWLSFVAVIYRGHVEDYLIPIKDTAIELIQLLKEKYHLK